MFAYAYTPTLAGGSALAELRLSAEPAAFSISGRPARGDDVFRKRSLVITGAPIPTPAQTVRLTQAVPANNNGNFGSAGRIAVSKNGAVAAANSYPMSVWTKTAGIWSLFHTSGSNSYSKIGMSNDGLTIAAMNFASTAQALVYTRSGATYNVATLTTANTGDQLYMGVAVSGDGLTVAIGIPSFNSFLGAVEVWKFSGSWAKVATLQDALTTGSYGTYVALNFDGTLLAVTTTRLTNKGAVLVYRNGGTWALETTISLPTEASVSTGLRTLMMTSDGSCIATSATVSKRVYVYDYVTGSWVARTSVTVQYDPADLALAEDGKRIFVGNGTTYGSIDEHSWDGSSWVFDQRLSIPGSGAGVAAASNGNAIFYGVPGGDSGRGAVYYRSKYASSGAVSGGGLSVSGAPANIQVIAGGAYLSAAPFAFTAVFADAGFSVSSDENRVLAATAAEYVISGRPIDEHDYRLLPLRITGAADLKLNRFAATAGSIALVGAPASLIVTDTFVSYFSPVSPELTDFVADVGGNLSALIYATNELLVRRDPVSEVFDVYDRTGPRGAWVLHSSLPVSGVSGNFFYEVIAHGSDELYCADAQYSTGRGRVLCYKRVGAAWVLDQEIFGAVDDTSGTYNASFGAYGALKISADGLTLAIGDTIPTTPDRTPYVHFYTRVGAGTWIFQDDVVAPDSTYRGIFGATLDLSDDGNTCFPGNGGGTYLLQRTGSAWGYKYAQNAPPGGYLGCDGNLTRAVRVSAPTNGVVTLSIYDRAVDNGGVYDYQWVLRSTSTTLSFGLYDLSSDTLLLRTKRDVQPSGTRTTTILQDKNNTGVYSLAHEVTYAATTSLTAPDFGKSKERGYLFWSGSTYEESSYTGPFAARVGYQLFILKTRILKAEPATLSLTGRATAPRLFSLTAAPRSLTLTGAAANLASTGGVDLDPTSFVLSLPATKLTRAIRPVLAPAALSLAAPEALLQTETVLVFAADPASFSLAGSAATFARGRKLDAQPRALALSCPSTRIGRLLTFTAAPAAFALAAPAPALPRTYLLNTSDASNYLYIDGEGEAYADLFRVYDLSAVATTLSLTASPALNLRALRLAQPAASYVAATPTAQITASRHFNMAAQPFVSSHTPALVKATRKVWARTPWMNITSPPVRLTHSQLSASLEQVLVADRRVVIRVPAHSTTVQVKP